MAFKFIAFLACVAAASAGTLPAAQLQESDNFDPHPQYSFSYDVQDTVTGDFKAQSETRGGDVVRGQYSLHDADGYRRVVDYSADAVNGFSAVVRREPLGAAPAPVAEPTPAAELGLARTPAPIAKPLPSLPPLPAPAAPPKPTKLQPEIKAYAQPAHLIRTYSAPTLVHHAPTHTLIHAAPVHLAPTAHVLHAAPAAHVIHSAPASHVVHAAPTAHLVHAAPAAGLLKTSHALIAHHAAPAVVKTSLTAPHYSYVY